MYVCIYAAFEVGSSLVKVVKAFEAYFKSNLGDYCDFLVRLCVECHVILSGQISVHVFVQTYRHRKRKKLQTPLICAIKLNALICLENDLTKLTDFNTIFPPLGRR